MFLNDLQIVNEQRLVLTNTQEAVMALRLTVPFGCELGIERCFLDLNAFIPKTDRCDVADVGIQTIDVNPCGIRFYNNETGITKYITLRTIITPRIQPQRRLIKGNLMTQRTYDAHPIFGGYLVHAFKVRVLL